MLLTTIMTTSPPFPSVGNVPFTASTPSLSPAPLFLSCLPVIRPPPISLLFPFDLAGGSFVTSSLASFSSTRSLNVGVLRLVHSPTSQALASSPDHAHSSRTCISSADLSSTPHPHSFLTPHSAPLPAYPVGSADFHRLSASFSSPRAAKWHRHQRLGNAEPRKLFPPCPRSFMP